MAIGRNKAQVPILLSIIVILVLQSGHLLAALEKENSSNSSVSWSIGRDTNDLRKGSESTESLEEDADEFTGGFSTLDSMLQWAIGTSANHNSRNFSISYELSAVPYFYQCN